MSITYYTAPGRFGWVEAFFDLSQQAKAGTIDISHAYEQFGRFILPGVSVPSGANTITALGYLYTPDTGGIRFPGGSYDPGELPLSRITGMGFNKIINGVETTQHWVDATYLNLSFATLFAATTVEQLERSIFMRDDYITYFAPVGSPDRTNDVLHGWAGNDIIEVYNSGGIDSFYGGGGNDRISTSGSAAGFVAGVTREWGEAGNDTLIGDNGRDLLYGGTQADSLTGNGGNDVLDGGAGNDTLFAGAGDDVLFGGAGVDSLYASTGRDVMTGGTQADLFIFAFRASTSFYDSGLALAARDEITDFQIGLDDLRFTDFSGGTLTAIGGAAFTAPNQLRWVVSGGDTTIFLNADTDAAPEMAITLTGVTGLQASDFVL